MLLRSLFVFTLHCASALRIPDTIYITTQSSIDVEEAAAAESGIKTELVAPEASNLNQFYQQQNHPQINYLQQPAHHHSPFLYTGPLILIEDPGKLSHQNGQRNIERNSLSQEKNSYKLYRPSPQDNPQFVDMLPPSETQEEPNYYLAKPKKNKKYSEKDDGEKKKTLKKKQNLKKNILENEVFENNDEDLIEKQPESAPEAVNLSENSNEYQARRQRETSSTTEDFTEDDEPIEESQPASRLDFAMHGHKGPDTYKYGYDSGRGKNRQYKIEEKDENGDVLGQYGYYDNTGKLRTVKYSVKKNGGFRVL